MSGRCRAMMSRRSILPLHHISRRSLISTRTDCPREVLILGAARTPIGAFNGLLRDIDPTQLGTLALSAALAKGSMPKDAVEALYFGNALSAGLGQAPARQVSYETGLPETVTCTGINKACSSGLKAITLAASDVALGLADVVACGGMESMSRAPFYIPKMRFGARLGNADAVDGMIHDGLWDAHENVHMGTIAERMAKKMGITREEQDNYAARSYTRAAHASFEKGFKAEMTPVPLPGVKPGEAEVVTEDEEVKRFDKIENLPQLKPLFDHAEGTLTKGNSSKLGDGAAAVVLSSRTATERRSIKPLARILAYADAECAPADFPIAPSKAIPRALGRAGMTLSDVDLFEINESSAAALIANHLELDLDQEKVNVFGGAIALGHPIGMSGARILVTLLNALVSKDLTIGIAAIANGGGGSTAIVVERLTDAPTG